MEYEAPCGSLLLGALSGKLCLCDWRARSGREIIDRRLRTRLGAVMEYGPSDATIHAAHMLDGYFDGTLRVLDVPLLLAGTDFQIKVWCEIIGITYGETASYSEIAGNIGSAGSVRAAAAATGANALSILVPCHRVLGTGGALTGYAGGLEAKRSLLSLETKIKRIQ